MTRGIPDNVDIAGNVDLYLGQRTATARYTSFDYCFNYFRAFHESDCVEDLAAADQLEVSCLQLGWYLASWGMLRGSTVLHKRSGRYLVPVVEHIASVPPELWDLDVDAYTSDACEALIGLARDIRRSMPERASDILVTKIMLGVFGSVPAFDTQFKAGFGAATFSVGSLARVGEFYKRNAEAIDDHRVTTLSFGTGQPTGRRYTRAKVIDMVFFIAGSPG